MKRIFFYAAGIVALGYALKRVPWARINKYLAETDIPEALADRLDSWKGAVRNAAHTVLDEPHIAKAMKNVSHMHS